MKETDRAPALRERNPNRMSSSDRTIRATIASQHAGAFLDDRYDRISHPERRHSDRDAGH